jgi:methionyl-tRNA formyltransferase
MNIIFFGNTKYSLIGAKIIHEKLGIAHIVTIPDRPDKKGRMLPSPLKTFALDNNIQVIEVNKLDDATIDQIALLQPDFLVVEDYGLILPKTLLETPRIASLNIHHSLLPQYRGPSPAPTALLNGDKVTGVTVMKMAEGLDAGDILAQQTYNINKSDTTDSLLTHLNMLGAELLVQIIEKYKTVKPIPQNENQATFTKMLKKEDGFFDIAHPPKSDKLDRMIHAYYPWPTVWTKLEINGKEKIVKFLPTSSKILLQVEGKNPMTVKDFINGYPQLKNMIERILS